MGIADNSHADQEAGLLPQSKAFWGAIVLSVLMVLVGQFLMTGPIAGMMGVWAASIFLTTVIGYALYRVWWVYES